MESTDSLSIRSGDFVIIKRQNFSKLVQVSNNKLVYINKQKLDFSGCIGKPFCSTFEIKGKDLHYVENPLVSVNVDEGREGKDNRFLIDDGKSQKLTRDDIERFKSEGLSGTQIIKNLVENSTTFKDKSHYAQAKYLKKKQQKYFNYIQIFQPTPRLLAEMYFMQGPLKICNLRIDSLAQMLCMCNVMSGGKYIVADFSVGLLAAAVIERIGNSGCVVQLYPKTGTVNSHRQAVHALNLPRSHLHSIAYQLSVEEACSLLHGDSASSGVLDDETERKRIIDEVCHETMDLEEATEETLANEQEAIECENESLITSEEKYENDTDEVISDKKFKVDEKIYRKEVERNFRRAEREVEQRKARDILNRRNMDGLLIVCKQHPLNILLGLIDFLGPSRSFAVFCMYQTPLMDCYIQLKSRSDVIFLNLTETWMRRYQILAERTHPDINMSGSGGYLLTGIKILPQ